MISSYRELGREAQKHNIIQDLHLQTGKIDLSNLKSIDIMKMYQSDKQVTNFEYLTPSGLI